MNLSERRPSPASIYLKRTTFSQFLVHPAILLVLLFSVAAPSWSSPPDRPIKVLMLHFGDKDAPAFELFRSGLRTKLEQELDSPVWMFTETFDEGWLGHAPQYAVMMERFLRDKYEKRGIDVVIPVGEYPLGFMQARRKTLLRGSKLLYLTLGRSPQQPISDATGMVLRLYLGSTVEIALSQNPGARRVLIITGATALDRSLAQLALDNTQNYLREKNKKIDIQLLAPGTFAESKKVLSALPPDFVTIFLCYYGDSVGEGFVPVRLGPLLSTATNRPMYSWIDPAIGRGAVGGNILDPEANGELFASLAVRVIHGENPADIPEIQGNLSNNKFDWNQMKRWRIPMNRVPSGATVVNREFTVWELYKWRIIGLIGLVIVQALLIANLIILAVRLRRNVKQLAHRRQIEALIAQSAAAFINLPPELVNSEIETSFQSMLKFFDVDRLSLFEFSPEKTKLHLLCTRVLPGIEEPPRVIDMDQLLWSAMRILGGVPILVSRLGELPEEAVALKDFLSAGDIRSFAAFPLIQSDEVFGILSFSTVRVERVWDEDVVQAMRTVANVLGSALKRKQAEEAAQESQTQLVGIVDSAMDAIIAIDAEQRIVVFNSAAEKMFGCRAEETLGAPIDRFIPHHFRAEHDEHIARFGQDAVTNRAMGRLGSIRGLRASGEEFPIEASISQVTIVNGKLYTVIIRDITERAQAELQLRKSNDLNLSILHSLRNHLAVLDSKGTVIAATAKNPELVAISGFRLLDLRVGDNYLDMCGAAIKEGDVNATAAQAGIVAVYDAQKRYFEMQYDIKFGNDSRWFQMSVTPLRSGDGVVISHEDITLRKRHEQAIQELSGRLINAQEQERSRIARELHDDINQQVAVLAIELHQLKTLFPEESSEGNERVNALWKRTHALSMDIQRLSHRLHSSKLDHLGIVAALSGLSGEFSGQNEIEIDFQYRQVPPLDSETSLSIFRVVQESLHNVSKHSQAQKVLVELIGSEGAVVLRVSDDGVGFDRDSPDNQNGLGMVSMSERIRSVGGTLSVWSRHSMGTQIEATIPVPQPAPVLKDAVLFPTG